MTRPIHRDAEGDLAAASRYHLVEAGKAVAGRFLNELDRVARLIEAHPGLGIATSDGRRACPLRGFPYSLICREVEGGIQILIIRHQSRTPAYGQGPTWVAPQG